MRLTRLEIAFSAAGGIPVKILGRATTPCTGAGAVNFALRRHHRPVTARGGTGIARLVRFDLLGPGH